MFTIVRRSILMALAFASGWGLAGLSVAAAGVAPGGACPTSEAGPALQHNCGGGEADGGEGAAGGESAAETDGDGDGGEGGEPAPELPKAEIPPVLS